ncbi:MAG: hypothetical protein ABI304_07175 [Rudaea sp.]
MRFAHDPTAKTVGDDSANGDDRELQRGQYFNRAWNARYLATGNPVLK